MKELNLGQGFTCKGRVFARSTEASWGDGVKLVGNLSFFVFCERSLEPLSHF